MAPSATLRKCCNCEQLTKDRCSFRLQASEPICDRPICYNCKILIFRMRTNDPYHCDVHRIVRAPLHTQMQKKKLSLAGTKVAEDGEVAKAGSEEEEERKSDVLLNLNTASHTDTADTATMSLEVDTSTSVARQLVSEAAVATKAARNKLKGNSTTKVLIRKRLKKLPKTNAVPSCLCSVC